MIERWSIMSMRIPTKVLKRAYCSPDCTYVLPSRPWEFQLVNQHSEIDPLRQEQPQPKKRYYEGTRRPSRG